MSSLSASASSSSMSSSLSRGSLGQMPPSPPSTSSASSSKVSLDQADDENLTITANQSIKNGKRKSQEDLRLLAISTHMTELSYMISDIQTRIFEIQELRHKSQSSGDSAGTTAVIDQSLMNLDERLESVSKGMKSINDSLEPILQISSTPTLPPNGEANESTIILRKHATLLSEWEAVQDESEVLREELKEDKWLTVFRTVTDQADGMMSSLEKGVNRCQEFIWQVHRRSGDASLSQSTSSVSSPRNDKTPPTYEVFQALLESFEAKKKHYMPATSKVLSIIDKGVRDRVTKNGETLRRHAESAQRWRNLKERISRTDAEMENVRKILLQGDGTSEAGSSTPGTLSTRNGYLATPPSGSGSKKAISRSMSPLKNFARKITGKSPVTPVTPLKVSKNGSGTKTPSSEPPPSSHTLHRQRTSIFNLRGSQPTTPVSPGHKHSQSLTPDSSPQKQKVDATLKGRPSLTKQPWNSSTKIEPEDRSLTVKATPPKRAPSSTGIYNDIASSSGAPPHKRSLSRTSMASSRPWSPLTSSISTNNSSSYPPLPTFRPPSRAQTPARAPSRAQTPSRATARAITPALPTTTPPRARPKTPSHIPGPRKRFLSSTQSEAAADDDPMSRPFSPAFSTSGMSSASAGFPNAHPPRPPSRSMIPIPSVHLSSPSRPSTSMSNRGGRESPAATFRSSAARAQTPESTLRARVQQVPFWQGSVSRSGGGRPSLANKLPPSSFRDGSSVTSSRPPSRSAAGSRSGMYTPGFESMMPLHEYVPGNPKDPLDVEVGYVVNAIAHGLLVERVDPPLKKVPKDGEEIKAQYAFSNALSRKVVTCKLTTLTRSGRSGDMTTKKVMCRVGGGWQDLSHYILNRQAGM